MNPISKKMEEVLVNDQVVKVPTTGEWGEIATRLTFMNAPVRLLGGDELASHLLAFVTDHAGEFSLGLYQPGAMRSWMVLPLLRNNGFWQRVQIERIACGHCSAQVIIANPAEPSLYFGVADELEALRRATTMQQVVCPNCGGGLGRPAIWAELTFRTKANV